MTSLAAYEARAETGRAGGLLVAGVVLAALTEAVASTVLTLGRAEVMGDTAATPDEFAWLDVGYTALKLAGFVAAPWLSDRLGPRRLLLLSTLVMGAACALAALTADLGLLTLLRAAQGFAGGVLLVAGQTLLFLVYPRTAQPMVQAAFAIGAVVAPATLAPAVQGWLIDSYAWTWITLAAGPVALAAVGAILMADGGAVAPSRARKPFDWPGFVCLSASLACLAYVFSQGSRWDWFEAPRIVWLTVAAVVALAAFAARQAQAGGRGLLHLGAFRTDDFAFAFVVSFVAGAALFGSAYLIPSFALSVLAFTPTEAGLLLLPSGGLFVAALLLAAVLMQARSLPPIATVPFGVLLIMAAMWRLSGSSGQSGADDMALALLLRGLGLGFLFLSITLIAFAALPNRTLPSGIALFNVGRQLGGLIGVSGLQTLVAHQAAASQAVLAASLTAGAPAVATTTIVLMGRGLDQASAGKAASLLLGKAVAGQSAVIAFDAAFAAVALLFVAAAPVLIAVKVGVSRAGAARRARLSTVEGA